MTPVAVGPIPSTRQPPFAVISARVLITVRADLYGASGVQPQSLLKGMQLSQGCSTWVSGTILSGVW